MPCVITKKCTKCGACPEVCPVEAIEAGEDQYFINPEECIECDACIPECPEGAIFYEEDVHPDAWWAIERNRAFFA